MSHGQHHDPLQILHDDHAGDLLAAARRATFAEPVAEGEREELRAAFADLTRRARAVLATGGEASTP